MGAEQLLQRIGADLGAFLVVFGAFWSIIGKPAYRKARSELLELIATTVAGQVAAELGKWTSWRSDTDTRLSRIERELATLATTVHERTELGYAHPLVVNQLPAEENQT